jgi:hypothetical protein
VQTQAPPNFPLRFGAISVEDYRYGRFSPPTSQARARTLLHHRGEDGGHWSGRCRLRAGAAGFVGLRHGPRVLRKLGRGWATQKIEKGRGKKMPAGLDSYSSWVSSHCQIGTRKILFFFKSFYNLQTNLNFDDFYSRNKIQEHFTIQWKICIDMKCNK